MPDPNDPNPNPQPEPTPAPAPAPTPTPEPAPVPEPAPTPDPAKMFDAAYVEKLRVEAASARVKAREADTAREAAKTESEAKIAESEAKLAEAEARATNLETVLQTELDTKLAALPEHQRTAVGDVLSGMSVRDQLAKMATLQAAGLIGAPASNPPLPAPGGGLPPQFANYAEWCAAPVPAAEAFATAHPDLLARFEDQHFGRR